VATKALISNKHIVSILCSHVSARLATQGPYAYLTENTVRDLLVGDLMPLGVHVVPEYDCKDVLPSVPGQGSNPELDFVVMAKRNGQIRLAYEMKFWRNYDPDESRRQRQTSATSVAQDLIEAALRLMVFRLRQEATQQSITPRCHLLVGMGFDVLRGLIPIKSGSPVWSHTEWWGPFLRPAVDLHTKGFDVPGLLTLKREKNQLSDDKVRGIVERLHDIERDSWQVDVGGVKAWYTSRNTPKSKKICVLCDELARLGCPRFELRDAEWHLLSPTWIPLYPVVPWGSIAPAEMAKNLVVVRSEVAPPRGRPVTRGP